LVQRRRLDHPRHLAAQPRLHGGRQLHAVVDREIERHRRLPVGYDLPSPRFVSANTRAPTKTSNSSASSWPRLTSEPTMSSAFSAGIAFLYGRSLAVSAS